MKNIRKKAWKKGDMPNNNIQLFKSAKPVMFKPSFSTDKWHIATAGCQISTSKILQREKNKSIFETPLSSKWCRKGARNLRVNPTTQHLFQPRTARLQLRTLLRCSIAEYSHIIMELFACAEARKGNRIPCDIPERKMKLWTQKIFGSQPNTSPAVSLLLSK